MLVKGWYAPGFLKLLLSRMLVCVIVCVLPLRLLIITDPIQLVKQALQLLHGSYTRTHMNHTSYTYVYMHTVV